MIGVAVMLAPTRREAAGYKHLAEVMLAHLSPVLRTAVCADFKESIDFDDVQEQVFLKLLWLACGKDGLVADGYEEYFDLGALAERLQLTAVVTLVEDTLLKELKTELCAEMLRRSESSGLYRLQRACERMFRFEFEEVSQTEGFLGLSEQRLCDFLENDELGVGWEEDTLKAVLKWMERAGRGGDELLKKIRYGTIDAAFLAGIATSQCRHKLLIDLVGEAMVKKKAACGEIGWDGVERLCDKWMVARTAPTPVANLPAGTIVGADVLQNPLCVALNQEGGILVCDQASHEIIVFNRDGSVARRFGSEGTDPGQFKGPVDVAVDRRDRIIVADHGNHRIQVLNADGSVVRCFGSEGTEVGQLMNPLGVTVDREGRIVVADSRNHRIQVFNADGSVARHFGSKGAAVGQLDGPVGVAVDAADRIVVVDQNNHRVQVFDADGSVALCFGSKGTGPGQFNQPNGLAVDREGRFVVADLSNHRIQVFDSDGSVSRVIGALGTGVGEFKLPYGVVVDGAGRILVAEAGWFEGIARVQVL